MKTMVVLLTTTMLSVN